MEAFFKSFWLKIRILATRLFGRSNLAVVKAKKQTLFPELFPDFGKMEKVTYKPSSSKGGRPPKEGKIWKCRLDTDNFEKLTYAAKIYGCEKTLIVNYALRKELEVILKNGKIF